ncbi:Zinc/iron permease [Fennellomyces sp. T-0311]|nr:Zinc/iron permease [Fennellomyces sp. T-0311]
MRAIDEDQCAADAKILYNRPIHIAAIFIIFAVSGFGVLIPIISKFVPSLGIPSRVVTFGKSFGIGVIIATAFIHMLQPAFEKLTSACLGDIWHEKYPAFAPLFAMCAILIMQLIEYVATARLEHRYDSLNRDDTICSHHDSTCHPDNIHSTTIPEAPPSPYRCADEEARHQSQSTVVDESVANEAYYIHGRRAILTDDKADPKFTSCPAHVGGDTQSEQLNDTKRWLSTMVLEFGILTHSVIIGITLGVCSQDEFTGLLIAVCFHQFFEGFALGARIAEVNMINLKKAISMASFFAVTTPTGVAIGVGISSTYNENSSTALLAQGIFDAVSSGILIYVGLVNLLASEMLFDDRFKKMRRSTKIGCFISLYAGAAVMAVIGIWI